MPTSKFAIVIPFCDKDFRDLQFNIRVWKKKGHILSTLKRRTNIDLVLYFATSNKAKINITKNIIMKQLSKYKIYFNISLLWNTQTCMLK